MGALESRAMSSCPRQVPDTYIGGRCTVGSEEMFVLNTEQMNSPLRQQLIPPFYRQHCMVLKGEVICQAHTGAKWRNWDAACLIALHLSWLLAQTRIEVLGP